MKYKTLKVLFLAAALSNLSTAMDVPALHTPIEERDRILRQCDQAGVRVLDTYMQQWHEEDYQALTRVVKFPENQGRLGEIYALVNQLFGAKTVTHCKLAASYILYSIVLSLKSELDGAVDGLKESIFDDRYGAIRDYVQTGQSPQGGWEMGSPLWLITMAEPYRLRCVPFVSQTGIAPFRNLNSLCAKKAPIIGVPLERES